MRYLIVDDNPTDRKLLAAASHQYMLTKGYKEYVEAENGFEALKILDKHNDIGFMFLDVNMPVMDGKRLLRVLRGNERYYQLPIIMLTGDHSGKEDSHISTISKAYATQNTKVVKTGFTDFLFKPIHIELLKEKVDSLCHNLNSLRV